MPENQQNPQEAWTPQRIREHFQESGFDTFDGVPDEQIQYWIDHGLWDANRQVFRPERTGRGGEALNIDYSNQPDFKPQDCPAGMVPWGADSEGHTTNCVPMEEGQGGQSGSGGGGGGQGGGGGGGGSDYDNPIFAYLRQTGLEAAGDPEKALQVYMGMGGAGQYQGLVDSARTEAEALPAGPARDAAMSRLSELKLSGLGKMRESAAAASRGDLQGLLGSEMGYNELAQNQNQFSQGLNWDKNKFGQEFGLARDQFNLGANQWNQSFGENQRQFNLGNKQQEYATRLGASQWNQQQGSNRTGQIIGAAGTAAATAAVLI